MSKLGVFGNFLGNLSLEVSNFFCMMVEGIRVQHLSVVPHLGKTLMSVNLGIK